MAKHTRLILELGGLDGKKARLVITKFADSSKNTKTGEMVQTFITPLSWTSDAQNKVQFDIKQSQTVCGDCPLMTKCYVKKGHAAMGLRSSAKSTNGLSLVCVDEILPFVADKKIRFGSFGEPVLMGEEMVASMSEVSSGWTGYTHQWKNESYQWAKKYFMASVHTLEEMREAQSKGWRTFRTSADGTASDTEVLCPASKEAGQLTTCDKCGLCQGASKQAKSIFIPLH